MTARTSTTSVPAPRTTWRATATSKSSTITSRAVGKQYTAMPTVMMAPSRGRAASRLTNVAAITPPMPIPVSMYPTPPDPAAKRSSARMRNSTVSSP